MCVCKMADLPGRLVAFTSTCTTKLDRFGGIKTCGKSNFENVFLEVVSQLPEEIIFINNIGGSNF